MIICKVIAISNQKGGVVKTTTTLSLGVALFKLGKKVLLIDVDLQGDLTICMGYYEQEMNKNSNNKMKTIATMIGSYINNIPLDMNDVILNHEENIDLIPSNLDLSAMELPILNAFNREAILKNCLENIKENYDYILIDCMSSLGMITINALSASDKIIVPVQSQYLSLKSVSQLLDSVSRIQKHINPNLEVGGLLLTMYDNRINLSQQIKDTVKNEYGKIINVYKNTIPVGIKVAKSTASGKSFFSYDKNSKVADAYYRFAKEVDMIGKEKRKKILQ